MTTMASQITSLTVVYSTVYSDADQRKHQSSASLAFVWGIHRERWIPRTKGQLRGKYFHLMTSSWSGMSACDTDMDVYHIGAETKSAILQTSFSNAFSSVKMFEFRFKFTGLCSSWGPIGNESALVLVMPWCRSGKRPLPWTNDDTIHRIICITRPQWVSHLLHFVPPIGYRNLETQSHMPAGIDRSFWWASQNAAENHTPTHRWMNPVHIHHGNGDGQRFYVAMHGIHQDSLVQAEPASLLHHE